MLKMGSKVLILICNYNIFSLAFRYAKSVI